MTQTVTKSRFRFWNWLTNYCLVFVTEIARVRWVKIPYLGKIFIGILILLLTVGALLFGYEKVMILLFQKLRILN